ncbi:MAG TPA: hemerythrin domain-containing protein [Acidobacteriota bacterium]|jgi:iron-sulfur cluster repair protein YtfE (RIC family)
MKRSEKLRKLSEDHHHGLVVAMVLKGERKLPEALGWNGPLRTIRARLLSFWDTDLQKHFRQEEEEVFPAADLISPAAHALCESLRSEHQVIRQQIGNIRAANEKDLAPLLAGLGNILEQHIRKEERELFELIEAAGVEDMKDS